ncbi:hypothetical protein ZOSMA_4199G00010, partial [Zostera marina]
NCKITKMPLSVNQPNRITGLPSSLGEDLQMKCLLELYGLEVLSCLQRSRLWMHCWHKFVSFRTDYDTAYCLLPNHHP